MTGEDAAWLVNVCEAMLTERLGQLRRDLAQREDAIARSRTVEPISSYQWALRVQRELLELRRVFLDVATEGR